MLIRRSSTLVQFVTANAFAMPTGFGERAAAGGALSPVQP
jgi:hypothetical protein